MGRRHQTLWQRLESFEVENIKFKFPQSILGCNLFNIKLLSFQIARITTVSYKNFL